MKNINNMVENSVKEYSQNYISDKDKLKLKKDIKEAVFAIVFLVFIIVLPILFSHH